MTKPMTADQLKGIKWLPMFADIRPLVAEIERLKELTTTATPFCAYCGKIWDPIQKSEYKGPSDEIRKHIAACKKNPLVQEIERLKGLVKSAYREGGARGLVTTHVNDFDEDNYYWTLSNACKALGDK